MSDISEPDSMKKLSILLPYLLAHNSEHAREIEKWMGKALGVGCLDVAKELNEVHLLMEKIGDHLKTSMTMLGSVDTHDHHHDHDHSHDGGHHHDHHHD